MLRAGARHCAARSSHQWVWFRQKREPEGHPREGWHPPEDVQQPRDRQVQNPALPAARSAGSALGIDQRLDGLLLARADAAPTRPLWRPGNGPCSIQFYIDIGHTSFLQSVNAVISTSRHAHFTTSPPLHVAPWSDRSLGFNKTVYTISYTGE